MPAIRHASKRKPPPEGFSDIEDDLLIFANKMKDAQNKPPPPGPRHRAQWEVFQISHQRSRYIYDLYYEKEAISKQLYDWLLKNGYADAMLIAKWKKQGYEKACLEEAKLAIHANHPSALLPPMRPNQGNQLQQHMHMPRPESTDEGRQGHAVRQLWLQRLCLERLVSPYRQTGWGRRPFASEEPSVAVSACGALGHVLSCPFGSLRWPCRFLES